MNDITFIGIIILAALFNAGFIVWQNRQSRNEDNLHMEKMIMMAKSKDLEEYNYQAIKDEPLPSEDDSDELVELGEIDENRLLKILKRDENNED